MADENENNLPATQEPESELPTLRLDQLPERRLAAETVTDVLPAVVYQNIGGLSNTLSPEQEALLDEPTPDDEVEIRPDGLVYAGHEWYRRKLNKVFGRFGWTLIPGSPLKNRLDKNQSDRSEWYQRWVLFVNGIYVSEAIASRTLYENNRQMTLDDVAEAIKSDALKRTCKDLGIANELWQKRWTERWRREHAVKVPCRVWKRGQQVTEELWRRRDQDALEGELTTEPKRKETVKSPIATPGRSDSGQETHTTGAEASGSQSTAPASNVGAGKTSKSTTSIQQQRPSMSPESSNSPSGIPNSQNAKPSASAATWQKPSPSGSPQSSTEQGARTSATNAAASHVAQPMPQGNSNVGVGSGKQPAGPAISTGQVHLVLAHARAAELIVNDDPTLLMDILERGGIPLADGTGRTQMENAIAMVKSIPMRGLNAVLKAIDAAVERI